MLDQPHLIFEVTPRCNNNCLYCYNVWKQENYPQGELDTAGYLRVMERVIPESNSRSVTFSGGEPLLRNDLEELVRYAVSFGCKVMLVTNGVLLNQSRAEKLVKAGVSHFELPILSDDRVRHNELCRNNAFDSVTFAIPRVKSLGANLSVSYVMTKKNIHDLEGAMEVALALGGDYFVIDRFVPGGEGLKHLEELLPHPRQVEEAVRKADSLVEKFHMKVTCPIPLEPCHINTSGLRHIKNGTCGGGEQKFVIDPLGNMRICEQNPLRLGNVLTESFIDMASRSEVACFLAPPSAKCADCQDYPSCRGGCRFISPLAFE